MIYVLGLFEYSTISIFSRRSSRMIECTRFPFIPTQAPTGSISLTLEQTATFALSPASLTTFFISMILSEISGTSISKSLYRKRGAARDTTTWGPLPLCLTSIINDRILSPWLKFSPQGSSFLGSMASASLPRSMIMSPHSKRFTMPFTISPTRFIYSLYILSLSASYTFCRMTCLAV